MQTLRGGRGGGVVAAIGRRLVWEGLGEGVGGEWKSNGGSLAGWRCRVEVRVCGGLFSEAANVVQATEGQQLALVLVVVGHGLWRGLDVQARPRPSEAVRGRGEHLVRLAAFGHALAYSHANAQQICLAVGRGVGGKVVSGVGNWPCVLVPRTGEWVEARQVVAVVQAVPGVKIGRDARLELFLAGVLLGERRWCRAMVHSDCRGRGRGRGRGPGQSRQLCSLAAAVEREGWSF